MSAQYDVYLLAPDSDYVLAYLGSGSSADAAATGRPRLAYSSLTYTNAVNAAGPFEITVPYPQFDPALARKDARLVVWRKPESGKRILDYAGFLRPTRSGLPEVYQKGDSIYYVLRGVHYNHILKRRRIAYRVDVAGYQHTGAADDIMKDFVHENLGAGAGAGRDMSAYGFTIQADATAGTTCSKQASYDSLLDTLRDISDDSHTTEATCIYFGVVPLNNGWQMEFRTNKGQWGNDHRHPSGPSGVTGAQGPVVLSLQRQNLKDVSLIGNSMDEVDYAYGLGQEEGILRNVQTASDTARIGESPLNRMEDSVNANNCETDADVLAAAQARLREGFPHSSFSATLVDVPGTRYGVHYGLGDYVTAEFLGQIYDCRIDSVSIRVADGVEQAIDAQIRSGANG